MTFTLDLGCGLKHRGTVNADRDRNVKPDLVCDVHHLPFRAKTFDRVLMHHVIEHVDDPERALNQALRVAQIIEISTPAWFHPKRHGHILTPAWFQQYAKSWSRRCWGIYRFDVDRTFYFFPIEYFCILYA